MKEIPAVEEVLRRMRELTSDLEKLHARISNQVFEPGKSLSGSRPLGVAAGSEIIPQFQQAVDNLRHILWLYSETAEFTAHRDSASRTRLLQRATEILCALSLHPPLPKLDSPPCGDSLVERLMQLMETSEPKSQAKSSPEL